MFVCTYVCMYVCMYVSMVVCRNVCIYLSVYVCMSVCMLVCTFNVLTFLFDLHGSCILIFVCSWYSAVSVCMYVCMLVILCHYFVSCSYREISFYLLQAIRGIWPPCGGYWRRTLTWFATRTR